MIKIIEKIKGAIAPIVLVMSLSSQVVAEDNVSKDGILYSGLGFATAKVITPTEGYEDVTYGVLVRVGYDFNKYIGIEGRILKTMWKYEQQKIEHIGLFAKPKLSVTEDMNIYALIGYGKVETGHKIVFDDTGMAWGVGMDYDMDNSLGVFIDYERLLQKSDTTDFNVVSLGMRYDF
jgi:opacity protein-like surface antigen